MSKNKIFFHTLTPCECGGIGNMFDVVNAHGIPFGNKCADSYGPCWEASGHEHGESVWRLTTRGQGDRDQWGNYIDYDVPPTHAPPYAAAEYQWNVMKVKIPKEFRKDVDWIETCNEVKFIDPEAADWYGEYALHIARMMNAEGYKCLNFGLASGEPETWAWEQPQMIQYLRYCADHPDMAGISLHEYSYTVDDLFDGFPYKLGRFQFLNDFCDRMGIGRPTIFITEFGWTLWEVPSDTERGMAEIDQAARMYAKARNVKRVYLWCLSRSDDWKGIGKVLNRYIPLIRDYTISTELPEPEDAYPNPGPDPDPEPEPEMTWQQAAWKMSEDLQEECGISLNPEAALQAAILADGFVPVHAEVWHEHPYQDGIERAYMAAETLDGSKPRRLYYAVVPDWNDVRWIVEPDEPVPPPPGNGSPVPDVILDVEPLSQRDPRWEGDVLGQNTGHSKTIGNWGCLLTAYNVMGRYLNITSRNPGGDNEHYTIMGAFSGPAIMPGALKTAYPTAVTYHGYKTRGDDRMRPQIREWLDMGIPVPARVDFNPSTAQWEQHWVLLIGYKGDSEFWMMDPWFGDVERVNVRYPISGSDVLEALFYKPSDDVSGDTYPYHRCYAPPAGRTHSDIVIRDNNWGAGAERVQMIRGEDGYVYLTKNSNYEMWQPDPIRLIEDTSPEPGQMYKNQSSDPWMVSNPYEGQEHVATETVTFLYSSGNRKCQPVDGKPTYSTTTARLYKKFHPSYTVPESGLVFENVHEVWWMVNGQWVEKYWGVEGLPRCRWENREGRVSWASEVIPLGQQGNNEISKVNCNG
jgi:hypothetical protein